MIAEVGDPSRFARESKFARWCGTGAIALSSGEGAGLPVKHRLDFRGNRRINSVLYIASVTQQRDVGDAQAYIDRKLSEGKTRREARRAHKRHLANRVIRRMWTDESDRRQRFHDRSRTLTPVGRVVAQHCADQLTNVKVDPAPEQLGPALVIVAPPRSGSTYLQHLLASLPHTWALRGWHCAGRVNDLPADRVVKRRRQRDQLDRLLPALSSRHPLGVTGPEEMNQLGARFGVSLTHLTLFGLRPFDGVAGTADAYAAGPIAAALSEARSGASTRAAYSVIKCPELFHRFADIRRIWPSATLVHIDRDLGASVKSWRNLVEATQATTLKGLVQVDPDWNGTSRAPASLITASSSTVYAETPSAWYANLTH